MLESLFTASTGVSSDLSHRPSGQGVPSIAKQFAEARRIDEDRVDSGPILALSLLGDAMSANATDIHLDPSENAYRVRFRIDGILHDALYIDEAEGQRVVNQFRVLSRIDPTESNLAEGRWTGVVDTDAAAVDLDVRTTFIKTISGDKMAARLMATSDEDFDLETLGLTKPQREDVRDWLVQRNGILVVAGPTGSGKTTLLYTLAKMLDTPEQSVVALEDPVEKRFATMTQIEVGSDNGMNFADGIVASMRLDPDYLLIGETRDDATATASVAAANSGRTLLTSMHCNDAVGAVTNYRFWGVSHLEIATSLRFVISSRLVRKLCDHCKKEEPLSRSDTAWLQSREIDLTKAMAAVGCSQCYHTGYQGRIGIHDLWRIESETSKAIRDGVDTSELRVAGSGVLMRQGLNRVGEGATTVEELRRAGLS